MNFNSSEFLTGVHWVSKKFIIIENCCKYGYIKSENKIMKFVMPPDSQPIALTRSNVDKQISARAHTHTNVRNM